jgi:hypothetical protein
VAAICESEAPVCVPEGCAGGVEGIADGVVEGIADGVVEVIADGVVEVIADGVVEVIAGVEEEPPPPHAASTPAARIAKSLSADGLLMVNPSKTA